MGIANNTATAANPTVTPGANITAQLGSTNTSVDADGDNIDDVTGQQIIK